MRVGVVLVVVVGVLASVEGWVAQDSAVPGGIIAYLWWIFKGALAITFIKKKIYEKKGYVFYTKDEDMTYGYHGDYQDHRRNFHLPTSAQVPPKSAQVPPKSAQQSPRSSHHLKKRSAKDMEKNQKTYKKRTGDSHSWMKEMVEKWRELEAKARRPDIDPSEIRRRMVVRDINDKEEAIEIEILKVQEMERLLKKSVAKLDSKGCVQKLLCHLNSQNPAKNLQENNESHQNFSQNQPTLEDQLLLQIFSNDFLECEQISEMCPLEEEQLLSVFRSSWKDSKHLLY